MLYPMLAMIALTFAVAFYMLVLRVGAVRSGAVSMRYFRVYSGTEPPAAVQQAGRNFSNLFEMPVLFYVACVTALALGYQVPALQTLAWLFVAARLAHSVIHLSYNNVTHRLAAFMLANLFLLLMWALLAIHYTAR